VPKKKTIEPRIKPGIVWDGKKWRMFRTYEQIEKGKRKGFTRISFLSGNIYVRKMHIKRYPEVLQESQEAKRPNGMPKYTIVYEPKMHS
jgi:hypothetical protein